MSYARLAISLLIWPLAFVPALAVAKNVPTTGKADITLTKMDDGRIKDWLARWNTNITNDGRSNRYCDKANAEDLAWLVGPFVNGFYYGYHATGDSKWLDNLVDYTDSWVKRGVKEPDGFIGWPAPKAAGTEVDNLDSYTADSLLGEAVVLRPAVLMAHEVLQSPALKPKYGAKAEQYLKLAEQVYDKWDQRGAWRATKDGGMISIVLPYGIDSKTGKWTDGYAQRNDPHVGFSHPDNKANWVACWLLAMSDATGNPVYKERAAKWFTLMKSRMKPTDHGTYQIWNYWQPAGEWDLKPDGSTKHWVGVHPNAGYYQMDLTAIVDAYEHGVVFDKNDMQRLIATALAEKRQWDALAPYSPEMQKGFEMSNKPDGWAGLTATPWYLSLQAALPK